MKIIIQCAASKNSQRLGRGWYIRDGRPLKFVAHPDVAPQDGSMFYAHPDDLDENGMSWREGILKYNESSATNPFELLPAYRLYSHKSYEDLVTRFGADRVFILSAGWGLISADFLTPDYDITLSRSGDVPVYARRRKLDHYADFCQLPDDDDDICFLGGKDYQLLFVALTQRRHGVKKIFYNSNSPPAPIYGYTFERFHTKTRTNWQYECASMLVDGSIVC